MHNSVFDPAVGSFNSSKNNIVSTDDVSLNLFSDNNNANNNGLTKLPLDGQVHDQFSRDLNTALSGNNTASTATLHYGNNSIVPMDANKSMITPNKNSQSNNN